MWVLHSWLKNTSAKFGNRMQALQGGNVAKCSLTIMDENIAWLTKKANENLGG